MKSLALITHNSELHILLETLRTYEPNSHDIRLESARALEYLNNVRHVLEVGEENNENIFRSLINMHKFEKNKDEYKKQIYLNERALEEKIDLAVQEESSFTMTIDRLNNLCLLPENHLFVEDIKQIASVNMLKLYTFRNAIKQAQEHLNLLRIFQDTSLPNVESYRYLREALSPGFFSKDFIIKEYSNTLDKLKARYLYIEISFMVLSTVFIALLFSMFFELRFTYVQLLEKTKEHVSDPYLNSFERLHEASEDLMILAVTIFCIAIYVSIVSFKVFIIKSIESSTSHHGIFFRFIYFILFLFISIHASLWLINSSKKLIDYLADSRISKSSEILISLPSMPIFTGIIFLALIPIMFLYRNENLLIKKMYIIGKELQIEEKRDGNQEN